MSEVTARVRPLSIVFDWHSYLSPTGLVIFDDTAAPVDIEAALETLKANITDWRFGAEYHKTGLRIVLEYTGGRLRNNPKVSRHQATTRQFNLLLRPQEWRTADAFVNLQKDGDRIVRGSANIVMHCDSPPEGFRLSEVMCIDGVHIAALVNDNLSFSFTDPDPSSKAGDILDEVAHLLDVEFIQPPLFTASRIQPLS